MNEQEYIQKILQSLCTHYAEGLRLKSSDLTQLLEETIEGVKIAAKNKKISLDKETDDALKKYFILKGFSKLPTDQKQQLMQHIENDGTLIKGLF